MKLSVRLAERGTAVEAAGACADVFAVAQLMAERGDRVVIVTMDGRASALWPSDPTAEQPATRRADRRVNPTVDTERRLARTASAIAGEGMNRCQS